MISRDQSLIRVLGQAHVESTSHLQAVCYHECTRSAMGWCSGTLAFRSWLQHGLAVWPQTRQGSLLGLSCLFTNEEIGLESFQYALSSNIHYLLGQLWFSGNTVERRDRLTLSWSITSRGQRNRTLTSQYPNHPGFSLGARECPVSHQGCLTPTSPVHLSARFP